MISRDTSPEVSVRNGAEGTGKKPALGQVPGFVRSVEAFDDEAESRRSLIHAVHQQLRRYLPLTARKMPIKSRRPVLRTGLVRTPA